MHKSLPVLFCAFEVLNGWMPHDRYYGSINTVLIIFLILEKKIYNSQYQPTMWFLWQYAVSPENILKFQYFILSIVFSRAVGSKKSFYFSDFWWAFNIYTQEFCAFCNYSFELLSVSLRGKEIWHVTGSTL